MSRGDLSKAKIHVLIFTLFCSVAGAAQTTVIRPTEIDDVLANPGMGIETFNRFAGERTTRLFASVLNNEACG